MTENEANAVRFIEYIKKYEVETIDHIAKKDIIASTVIHTRKKEKAETILAMVEELKKYRAIGTPEECKTAMEKQKAKKPHCEYDGYSDGHIVYDTWICPCCGKRYDVDEDGHYDFCKKCGQHIDWSNE